MVECPGLWDTGATGTVITKALADQLGIKPMAVVETFHAQGRSLANVYFISLILPSGVGFPMLRVTEGILGDSLAVLIGMDVISRGDFTITNHGGATELHFQLPSAGIHSLGERIKNWDAAPAHNIVSPGFTRKAPPAPAAAPPPPPPKPAVPKQPRNAPCACGSGKKYKKCCGINDGTAAA